MINAGGGLTTCRQAKEMISGRCRRRERELLALPRQTLRLVIGVLTGHTQVGRHLSIMGLNQDPLCNYCIVAEESASHFLCHCDYFATLRMRIWGKPDIPRRYRYCNSRGVSSLDWNHRGWLMDLHRGLVYGAIDGPARFMPPIARGRHS